MKEHYIVTVDRGNLRIYADAELSGRGPRLEVVESMDLPSEAAELPESSDERLQSRSPVPCVDGAIMDHAVSHSRRSHRESRRNSDVLATELDTFLQTRPDASWDVAAAPAFFNAIISRISAGTRRRLGRVISKVMVNARAEEVRAQFASPVSG